MERQVNGQTDIERQVSGQTHRKAGEWTDRH